MAQRGLSERLNQHTQRTGPLVGCGMGLTLLVCMVSAMVLYQRLDEYRVDIFGIPTVVQSVPTVPPVLTAQATRRPPEGVAAATPQPAAPTPAPAAEIATPKPPAATKYQVARTSGENLNMRAASNTQSPILARLPPGAVVEDAGEQATGTAAGQQVTWRKVKAPGGQVGWVPDQYLDKVEG